MSNILIIGPPASGKSSLLSSIGKFLPCYTYHKIDDYVDQICISKDIKTYPIPVTIINDASKKILQFSKFEKQLIEISHHNYMKLIDEHSLILSDFSKIVLLCASIETLLIRNANRTKTIPEYYVKRCHESCVQIKSYLINTYSNKSLILNTECTDSAVILEKVAKYLKNE
jgi:shikimate kinase